MTYVDEVFNHPMNSRMMFYRCGENVYGFDKYKCRLSYDQDIVVKNARPVHIIDMAARMPVNTITAKVFYNLQVQG